MKNQLAVGSWYPVAIGLANSFIKIFPRKSAASYFKLSAFSFVLFTFSACTKPVKEEKLPILGETRVEGTDTVYHTIAPFKFVDQDSAEVTKETVKGKIYVADFFFTSCGTICPKMKTQMRRAYDSVQSMPDVIFLS